jgi:glucosamine-phosphate N-acetyltransferase
LIIDFAGFLEALGQLTTVGKQSKEQFMGKIKINSCISQKIHCGSIMSVDRYSYLQAHSHEYFTIVCEDLGKQKIVGAGTLFIERKFVHNNGLVGHVEDIVTDAQYRASLYCSL